jgi:hypothetical protein
MKCIYRFKQGVIITTLMSCFGDKKEEENIISLPDYKPKLEEAIGKYYFIPIKDEFYNRDDYKYFNLKKGDTLFLEIKKDSTYSFNKFYFNQGESVTNLTGKLIIDKTGVSLSPSSDVKNATIYLLGFKKSKKLGLHYYYGINSPTDPTEFEYYITYKKVK